MTSLRTLWVGGLEERRRMVLCSRCGSISPKDMLHRHLCISNPVAAFHVWDGYRILIRRLCRKVDLMCCQKNFLVSLQKIVGMGKITLNLLENGLDFLCEALTPIVQTQDERKLKYSVLHICAGVELILKKIVFDINWQWIFKDESKASEQALSTGNFESINFGGIKLRLPGRTGPCSTSSTGCGLPATR